MCGIQGKHLTQNIQHEQRATLPQESLARFSALMWASAHMSLFHDTLAGQKTLFLPLHRCQESPRLHHEGEVTTRWDVKIRLHGTELPLERCAANLTQIGTLSVTSAPEAVTQMPLQGPSHTGLASQCELLRVPVMARQTPRGQQGAGGRAWCAQRWPSLQVLRALLE